MAGQDLGREEAETIVAAEDAMAVSYLDREWLRDYAKEHRAWRVANFGLPHSHHPVLGLIEELGEFYEACDFREREVASRSLVEGSLALRRVTLTAAETDAIGDILIYSTDFCGARDWSFADLWFTRKRFEAAPGKGRWAYYMRKLAHHQLKGEQDIRGGTQHHNNELQLLLCDIFGAVEAHYFDHAQSRESVLSILRAVWDKVSKRDWKTNPNTAHEVAGG